MAFNLTEAYATISSTWIEAGLVNPAKGTDYNQRIGNKIKLKSIQIYGVIQNGCIDSIAADDKFNQIRIVLAMWNFSTTGTNTPLNTTSTAIDGPIAKTFNLPNLRHKFFDKTLLFNTQPGISGYMPRIKRFKYFRRFRNTQVTFGQTSNYPDKDLQLSMKSDSTAIPNPGFINGKIILRFTDV